MSLPDRSVFRTRFRTALCACAIAVVVAGVAVRSLAARRSAASPHAHPGHAMSEEEMEAWVREWFSRHPVVGGGPAPLGASYADTFFAANTDFDADGDPTDIDTVRIAVGDSILWRRTSGSHTVTSGTGSSDPQAGVEFEGDLNSFATTFFHVFPQTGTFPFFCRPHEDSNMRGVVVVEGPVGVRPIAAAPGSEGFLGPPVPNPARSAVTVRFALAAPGRARLRVVDAAGRRVAVLLDETLPAGAYAARWDRRAATGNRAPAGAYFLWLEIPGAVAKEKLLIAD